MKKLCLMISLIGFFTLNSQAQDTFKKGTKLLEAAIGFNGNGMPILVSYEAGISDNLFDVNKLNLGLGAYLGYYGYETSQTNYGATSSSSFKIVAPGVRALVHYQLMNKLEVYGGPAIGISFSSASVDVLGYTNSENTVDFAWGIAAGLRYEITPKFGVFLEGGKATGNFTFGAALKL